MNIVISNTSNMAIYEQIVAQIKNAIINMEIKKNETACFNSAYI